MPNDQSLSPPHAAPLPSPISIQGPPTTTGSSFNPIPTVRDMLTYPVNDSEISGLAKDNTEARVFFSVASSLASIAIGIWTNAAFAEAPTPMGELLGGFFAYVLLAMATIFGWLGWRCLQVYNSTWDRIKNEARLVPIAAPMTQSNPGTQGSSPPTTS